MKKIRREWRKGICIILFLTVGFTSLCWKGEAAAGTVFEEREQISADAAIRDKDRESGESEEKEEAEEKEEEKGTESKEERKSQESGDAIESGDAKESGDAIESGDAKESGDAEEEKPEETEKKEPEKEKEDKTEDKIEEKEEEKEEKEPDLTEPKLEITFDQEEGENGRYFRGERSALISIEEENLKEAGVLLSGKEMQNLLWTKEGKSWQTRLTFSEEGDYILALYAEDQAGNRAYQEAETFTIDRTEPRIIISGIENESANQGRVSPLIEIRDEHLDRKEVELHLKGANRGEIPLGEGSYSEADGLWSLQLEDIPHEKGYDDLYTLEVRSKDLAGNETEERMRFSVNRYGSVYSIEGNPQEWMNRYNKEVPEVIVHEYNVDQLKAGESRILLTENGLVSEAEEGKDYQLSQATGEDGWKEYTYTMEKEAFAADGMYHLAFYSQDQAGNRNQSVKQLEISFGLDREAPEIFALNLQEKGRYETEGEDLEAAFSISDNVGLEKVEFFLDGKKKKAKEEKEIWSMKVPVGEKTHEIRVLAEDQAGNQTEYELKELMVEEKSEKASLGQILKGIFGGKKEEGNEKNESGEKGSTEEGSIGLLQKTGMRVLFCLLLLFILILAGRSVQSFRKRKEVEERKGK